MSKALRNKKAEVDIAKSHFSKESDEKPKLHFSKERNDDTKLHFSRISDEDTRLRFSKERDEDAKLRIAKEREEEAKLRIAKEREEEAKSHFSKEHDEDVKSRYLKELEDDENITLKGIKALIKGNRLVKEPSNTIKPNSDDKIIININPNDMKDSYFNTNYDKELISNEKSNGHKSLSTTSKSSLSNDENFPSSVKPENNDSGKVYVIKPNTLEYEKLHNIITKASSSNSVEDKPNGGTKVANDESDIIHIKGLASEEKISSSVNKSSNGERPSSNDNKAFSDANILTSKPANDEKVNVSKGKAGSNDKVSTSADKPPAEDSIASSGKSTSGEKAVDGSIAIKPTSEDKTVTVATKPINEEKIANISTKVANEEKAGSVVTKPETDQKPAIVIAKIENEQKPSIIVTKLPTDQKLSSNAENKVGDMPIERLAGGSISTLSIDNMQKPFVDDGASVISDLLGDAPSSKNVSIIKQKHRKHLYPLGHAISNGHRPPCICPDKRKFSIIISLVIFTLNFAKYSRLHFVFWGVGRGDGVAR